MTDLRTAIHVRHQVVEGFLATARKGDHEHRDQIPTAQP
jgi:hypothetical protein